MLSSSHHSVSRSTLQVTRVRPAFWGYYDETHLSAALLKRTETTIYLVWAAQYRYRLGTSVLVPVKKLDSEQSLAI